MVPDEINEEVKKETPEASSPGGGIFGAETGPADEEDKGSESSAGPDVGTSDSGGDGEAEEEDGLSDEQREFIEKERQEAEKNRQESLAAIDAKIKKYRAEGKDQGVFDKNLVEACRGNLLNRGYVFNKGGSHGAFVHMSFGKED